MEKVDISGYYIGDMIENYPHGHGKKIYINEDIYEGNWAYGRKHGIGTYKSKGKNFTILFKKGIPKTLLDSTNIFNSQSNEIELLIPFTYKQVGDYFIEEYKHDNNFKDCVYYMYYSAHFKRLAFKGMIFTKQLGEIKSIGENYLSLTAEIKSLTGSHGFIECNKKDITYIGYVHDRIPNGKGKLFYQGLKASTNFISGKINGRCAVEFNNMRLVYIFDKGLDSKKIVFLKNDYYINLFVDLEIDKLTSDEEFECDYIDKIKKPTLYILKALKYIEKKIFTLGLVFNIIYPIIESQSNKKIFNSNPLKKFKNWHEYEKHSLENKTQIKKNSDKNLNFIEADEVCRGIKIYNQEKYKGQLKNTLMHGCGMFSYLGKLIYNGEYANGLKNGIGCFVYNNTCRYKGHWKNDKKHGFGYLFMGNLVIYGKWENDQFIEQKSITVSYRNLDKIV
ncbi:hypothetical protein SteCoe_25651 [Stentor coeruleus]|uniref:MORN repeat-containing protein 5 n=1 Tax=Stentor coeruleus TaxID=5963 RepID=A0A1R2BES5_9CILI|nr:hypothetical protein SteCoe_25651 [Stentor coeruleus]